MHLEKAGSFDRRILKVIKHPKYKPPLNYYDIASVILDQEFEFDEDINPICLPTETSATSDFMNRYTVTVQGWGKDGPSGISGGQLTQIDLTIRKMEICNKKYENVPTHTVATWFPNLLTPNMFCADSNLDPSKGTCSGDSGGPAIIR